MVDLMKQVRLPLLSFEIIKDVIKTHSSCSNQNCIDSVLVQKSKGSSLDSFQTENRCCMHESVAFMFYDSSKSKENELLPYRSSERKIRLCTKTKNGFKFEPTEISLQALQFHNTKNYLQEYNDSLYKFPFSKISSQWTLTFPNSMVVEHFASCLFMGRLFILGGYHLGLNYTTNAGLLIKMEMRLMA